MKLNFLIKKIIFVIFLLSSSATLADAVQQHLLTNKINQALKNVDDETHIGLLIKDQDTGKVLYSKHTKHYFNPASNEKLFTAFAALHYLGKDFTFKTQVFVDSSKIQNKTLNDNVYLKFTGDPTLTIAQLDHLIHALSMLGIEHIQGKIIIDDSAFDQMSQSPGTTWDDKDFCWGAPISAIVVEGNCVKTLLTPAAIGGQLAKMDLPSYPQSLNFMNHVVTGMPTQIPCKIDVKRTNAAAYSMSGCIAPSTPPQTIAMAIDNPRANLQTLLIYLLAKNQITHNNHFEFGAVTTFPNVLATEYSPPLSSLITTMLKESDNLIANNLFKTIGSVYAKESGSFQNGSDAVRAIFNKMMQLDIPKTTLIDGDGASRYDFLTPEMIMTLLEKVSSFPDAAIFLAALPINGVDGTLKDRMKGTHELGRVHAKTGTETGVTALSGYITTRRGHHLIFSIMTDGFVESPDKYKDLEDVLCILLIADA